MTSVETHFMKAVDEIFSIYDRNNDEILDSN
jgi:hypothetical protein